MSKHKQPPKEAPKKTAVKKPTAPARPAAVTIPLATHTMGTRKYAAGRITLTFAGIPIDAFAGFVFHQDDADRVDRWVCTRESVIEFLVGHMLDRDAAVELVDDTGEHDHQDISIAREVKGQ